MSILSVWASGSHVLSMERRTGGSIGLRKVMILWMTHGTAKMDAMDAAGLTMLLHVFA